MKLFLLLCISSVVSSSPQCGIRPPKALNKTSNRFERAIIGGTNVTGPDKWPWQILLIHSNLGDRSDRQTCGGTIIGEKWVLTAAHCVMNATGTAKEFVYAGHSHSLNFRKKDILNVTEVARHPGWDLESVFNDIALLKLDTPLVFSDVIAPICLPSPAQSIPNGGQAIVTGFGATNVEGTDKTVTDGQLRQAIVPIVAPEVCEERWSHAVPGLEQLSIMIWRQRKVVCASSRDHGTHLGDSGGPLMMKASDGRWFQIGIASFAYCESDRCDKPGDGVRGDIFPKTFTDVRKYCDWIKETTQGDVKCQQGKVVFENATIDS